MLLKTTEILLYHSLPQHLEAPIHVLPLPPIPHPPSEAGAPFTPAQVAADKAAPQSAVAGRCKNNDISYTLYAKKN